QAKGQVLAHLIYSRRALADFERLTDFLLETDSAAALETAELLSEAVQILENHPFIGHTAEHGMSELVMSRGRTGYIALYHFEEKHDTVLILAIRHQQEVGYATESGFGPSSPDIRGLTPFSERSTISA
ncbi:MAG: type II toxin-antitoxin system RelE/ParE family toxin, partial [Terriglobia bacterium]